MATRRRKMPNPASTTKAFEANGPFGAVLLWTVSSIPNSTGFGLSHAMSVIGEQRSVMPEPERPQSGHAAHGLQRDTEQLRTLRIRLR
jgi:hypothetical protein